MALDRDGLRCACRCLLSLVHAGKAPNAGMLAANTEAAKSRPAKSKASADRTSIDTFEDRFPTLQFADRFPTADESLPQVQRQVALAPQPPRRVRTEPVRVASLTPTLTLPRTEREELTTLVSMKSSAFPYFGTNPRSEEPFLNISKGDRQGHRSYSAAASTGRTRPTTTAACWCTSPRLRRQEARRDRGVLPRQRRDAGARRPRPATGAAADLGFRRQRRAARAAACGDAADSSAGKFWQPGGFKRFIDESASHLARLYGDPKSAQAPSPTCRS